jgi:hypothetical protein
LSNNNESQRSNFSFSNKRPEKSFNLDKELERESLAKVKNYNPPNTIFLDQEMQMDVTAFKTSKTMRNSFNIKGKDSGISDFSEQQVKYSYPNLTKYNETLF